MRSETALACTSFLFVLFTIAVWPTPLSEYECSIGASP